MPTRRAISGALIAASLVSAAAGLSTFLLLRRRPQLARWARMTWGVWRAGSDDPRAIGALQRERLAQLVAFARSHSAYYRALYRDLPANLGTGGLACLPVVTKPELMAHFDDWVTDSSVTGIGIKAFVADPATIGERYLGRFAVWTTSGTTGQPGIFIHDPGAMAIYTITGAVRATAVMRLLSLPQVLALLRHGSRNALLAVTGGHFVGASETERLRRRMPRRIANTGRLFSVLQPLPDLVRELNEFQPNRISGYPTALALLAQEQLARRLHIHPTMLTPSGESITPTARERLQSAFGCPVRGVYSASEFLGIAFECPAGWLHVNADWAILEPVDADYHPVPPGTRSHTVLLTNLANRVQPLIRYDLGDSVTVKADRCLCGCRLPAIHVEGRTADVLHLQMASGTTIAVLPLALGTVVEEASGVRRCQIIQTGPCELTVRLEGSEGEDQERVWQEVARRLDDFLRAQGARRVTIVRDTQPPSPDPVSGKFRQVWSGWRPPEHLAAALDGARVPQTKR